MENHVWQCILINKIDISHPCLVTSDLTVFAGALSLSQHFFLFFGQLFSFSDADPVSTTKYNGKNKVLLRKISYYSYSYYSQRNFVGQNVSGAVCTP